MARRRQTLGRQSRSHQDEAKSWLGRAREGLTDTRSHCTLALPALVGVHEALAAAWEHITSIGESSPRDRRAKFDLQAQHRELNKTARRDYQAFSDRCVLRGRS